MINETFKIILNFERNSRKFKIFAHIKNVQKDAKSAKISAYLKECCIVSGVGMSYYYKPQTLLGVCHDSCVFLWRWFPLSMIVEWSKSITWSKVHSCLATLAPSAHCFVLLICSFLLVLNNLLVSPI